MSSEAVAFEMGVRTAARYRFDGIIAYGSESVVYRARDAQLERDVAFKVMSTASATDDTARARFATATRRAAAIDHRGVVAVHDTGEVGGRPYVTMPFLHGHDLRWLLTREAPLDSRLVLMLLGEVANTLDDLARAGGHGDVRPENIFLEVARNRRVRPIVLDVAPEGDDDLAAFADLLFECLTGVVPRTPRRGHDGEWRLVGDERLSVSAHRPDLHPGIDGVLARAIGAAPARPASCAALMGDLGPLLRSRRPTVPRAGTTPVTIAPRAPRSARLRRAVVGVTLLTAAILGWWMLGRAPGARSSASALPLVPAALRSSCHEVAGAVACRAAGRPRLVYTRYQTIADLRRAWRQHVPSDIVTDRSDAGTAACVRGVVEQGSWKATADHTKPDGRYACFSRSGTTVMVWTTRRLKALTVAESRVLDLAGLYEWWLTTPGPVVS